MCRGDSGYCASIKWKSPEKGVRTLDFSQWSAEGRWVLNRTGSQQNDDCEEKIMADQQDPQEAANSAKEHVKSAADDFKAAASAKADEIRRAAEQKAEELRHARGRESPRISRRGRNRLD